MVEDLEYLQSIDKAISELADCAYMGCLTNGPVFRHACKLGIEALLRIKEGRGSGGKVSLTTLPGEKIEIGGE